MTACVKKHYGKAALAITASLVGTLGMGAAAVPAFADGVTAQGVANDQQLWEASKFDWNIDADDYNQYNVEEGSVFALDSVTDVYDETVNPGDYTVLYFTVSNPSAPIEDSSTLVDAAQAINGISGGMPKVVAGDATPSGIDHYAAVVVKLPATGLDGITDTTRYGDIKFNVNHVQQFNVVEAQKSLEGAYAYKVKSDPANTSDTTFNYTGFNQAISFANADGEELKLGTDYKISWSKTQNGFIAATGTADAMVNLPGEYTATLYGQGAYEGTEATVSLTVNKLDLSKVTITTPIAYQDKGQSLVFNGTALDQSVAGQGIYANGELLEEHVLVATCGAYVDAQGNVFTNPNPVNGQYMGTYKLNLVPSSAAADNVVGTATADACVVATEATVDYDDEPVAAVFPSGNMTVYTSKGEKFDPALFTSDQGAVKVTVTKDGEAVAEYAEPGVYKVHVEVPTPKTCQYGFRADYTVTVVSRTFKNTPTVFASIDGTSVQGNAFRYNGEAFEPTIAVKDGKTTLVEGTDYTVTYKNAKGEAVESIVEPGEYTIVVSFPGAYLRSGTKVADITVNFKIAKGLIQSAKTAKDVYAYTGDAIAPDFTGYTGKNLDGTAVELPNSGVGVKYYEAVWSNNGTFFDASDDGWVKKAGATAINASNLKAEGDYIAEITVNSNNEHYETAAAVEAHFQISKSAGFTDVAADAWYAQGVYAAKELGYMTGIKGTSLFMPEAEISRAELAKVFSNMAGRPDDELYTPTKFSDVDAWAWYAEPVAWASEAGIVTGYGETSLFGPDDQATREQVAIMAYRYAKAQGKDVSVDDADATLAAYADGAQVSDWAKTEMAWAVENGVFGVNTDQLDPQGNITRGQVALIAVRMQPEALK